MAFRTWGPFKQEPAVFICQNQERHFVVFGPNIKSNGYSDCTTTSVLFRVNTAFADGFGCPSETERFGVAEFCLVCTDGTIRS